MRYLFLNFLFIFSVCCMGQTPTGAASNIVSPFIGCNEVEISWTNGNGSDRVVFVREDSAFSDVPVDNEYYSENPVFGKGESIKGDNKHFCVYRGPNNSITVKGLKILTKYYVAIFEFNNSGSTYNYKTDVYPTNNITTKNIIANGYLYDIRPTGQTSQCLNGNSFQFKNKSTSDLTPLTYSWDFGDGNSSNLKESKHSYKTIGIYTVTLIATTQGCYASNTFNDTVHEHPVAKFGLEPNDSIQCWYSNTFTFKNKSKWPTPIGESYASLRFEWYEKPNNIPFSTIPNPTYSFKTDGKKTIKLVAISNHGCRDSTYSENLAFKPRVVDLTKISVSPDSMPLKNNTFKFTNTSIKTWQIRSRNIPSFKDSVRGNLVNYSFAAVGRYYISFDTIDIKTGCYDKFLDSVEVTKDLGVLSKPILETVSIYPNPSKSGVFQINNLPVNSSLIVYSIIGEELLTLNPREINSEINLSHFRAGTYILTLFSEGRKFDYRLVVL